MSESAFAMKPVVNIKRRLRDWLAGKPRYLHHRSPKSREAFGQSLVDTGTKLFQSAMLLVTVGAMTVIAKGVLEHRPVSLFEALGFFSSATYWVFLGLLAFTLALGGLLRDHGLRHIREADREARRLSRRARCRR